MARRRGPTGQTQPTPDRYREIQQALIDKGYLKTDPTGAWDEPTSDAMKRFQTDRNLPPTGKVTAASLIGLGLGPGTAGSLPPAAVSAIVPPSPQTQTPAPATAPEPVEVPPSPDVLPAPDAAESH